jgi:uncharacterized protein (DUF2267 family)
MTVPQEYVQASRDFERFMADVMEASTLATHHRAYAVVRGVLHVFRDHLTVDQALRFADILPAVLRAIFVEDWHPQPHPAPFPNREQLIAEVRARRRHHNLADEGSIDDVAWALRRAVAPEDLNRVLSALPPAARLYWQL